MLIEITLICWTQAAAGPVVSLVAFYLLKDKIKIKRWLQLLLMILITLLIGWLLAMLRFRVSAALSGDPDHYEELLSPEIFSFMLLPLTLAAGALIILFVPVQTLPRFSKWRRRYKFLTLFAIIGPPFIGAAADPAIGAFRQIKEKLNCYRECEEMAAQKTLKTGMDAASCKQAICK